MPGVLIPEYQINDAENCLVLSPICQVRFSNLPCFNQSFLPVAIGDFLQKAPFENLPKTSENSKQNFPLFSFLAIMTLGFVADSHRCEVNTFGTFACNFSRFFKASQRE